MGPPYIYDESQATMQRLVYTVVKRITSWPLAPPAPKSIKTSGRRLLYTPIGHFKYLVMPFGLTKAPAVSGVSKRRAVRHAQTLSVCVY